MAILPFKPQIPDLSVKRLHFRALQNLHKTVIRPRSEWRTVIRDRMIISAVITKTEIGPCLFINIASFTEITNFKRNNTITCRAIWRLLLLSCPGASNCTVVSPDRRSAANFFPFWLLSAMLSLRTGTQQSAADFSLLAPIWSRLYRGTIKPFSHKPLNTVLLSVQKSSQPQHSSTQNACEHPVQLHCWPQTLTGWVGAVIMNGESTTDQCS